MLSDLGSEDHILACLDRHFPAGGERVLLGRGDDCAVLDVTGPLCVSTDLFMEDVHFRRSYCTPEDIGWKALAVNLSDLAACGARPVGFTVGLALPADADMALVDGLCAGMAELATQHDVPLVGGDLSRAERLHLCITVFGQAEKTLLRGVAAPGDTIFMVGRAGLARTGLEVLETYGRAALDDWPEACAAHLRPQPRLREGMKLSTLAASVEGAAQTSETRETSETSEMRETSETREASETSEMREMRETRQPEAFRLGLMDLSDGLARDLPRLVGKGRGAAITLPMPHREIARFVARAERTGCKEARGAAGQREHALSPAARQLFLGGEDYALIGTCAPELASRVMVTLAEAVVLGRVTDGEGLSVDGVRAEGGFDHFSA